MAYLVAVENQNLTAILLTWCCLIDFLLCAFLISFYVCGNFDVVGARYGDASQFALTIEAALYSASGQRRLAMLYACQRLHAVPSTERVAWPLELCAPPIALREQVQAAAVCPSCGLGGARLWRDSEKRRR